MSSSLGRMMTGGSNPASQKARKEGDFFPTPPDVTVALLRADLGPKFFSTLIWEPFAGDGAIASVLRAHCHLVRCSDIAPRAPGIERRDFFGYSSMPIARGGVMTIITNPPFSLAEETIRHAFRIGCRRMALVLKSTYWQAAERMALFEQHRPAAVMPLLWRPDFLGLGRPTMEAQWCVWDCDYSGPTRYEPLRRPNRAIGE